MAETLDQLSARTALVFVARDFHARGWMAGTAGNLSARSGADGFWITASGKPKGRLQEQDFLQVRVSDGEVLENPMPDNKPSAETAIHGVIYRLFPQAGACLHVHSVDACLATADAAASLRLPALEMLKGLGVWEQDPAVDLPVFENIVEVTHIAEAIEARFRHAPPAIPALMIRGHGVTVWGESVQQAYDRLECLEFILQYAARQAAHRGGSKS